MYHNQTKTTMNHEAFVTCPVDAVLLYLGVELLQKPIYNAHTYAWAYLLRMRNEGGYLGLKQLEEVQCG